MTRVGVWVRVISLVAPASVALLRLGLMVGVMVPHSGTNPCVLVEKYYHHWPLTERVGGLGVGDHDTRYEDQPGCARRKPPGPGWAS